MSMYCYIHKSHKLPIYGSSATAHGWVCLSCHKSVCSELSEKENITAKIIVEKINE